MEHVDIRDPAHWLPRDLFASYCGSSTDKLLAYYDKAKARKKIVIMAFDPLAFFVLPAWLGYRRQWTLWATLVGTIAVISAGAAIARVELPTGVFGGSLIALGLMAHGLLLTNANGQYAKLKRQGASDEAIRAALSDRAKPSAALAFAALAAAIALQVLVIFIVPG